MCLIIRCINVILRFLFKNEILKFLTIYGILKVLSESRTSVVIGITGSIIAILVFIAGILSDKKVLEVEKNALLDKLKLERLLKCSLIALLLSWLLEVIEKFYVGKSVLILFIFSFFEIIEICFIIYVSLRIYEIFVTTINMVRSIDIKNNEVKNYILRKCSDYIKFCKKLDDHTSKNKSDIDKLTTKYGDLFYYQSYEIGFSKYDKLCFNQNGYIENIDIDELENILQNMKDARLGNCYKSDIRDNERKVILTHYPGEKIEKDEALFYIAGDIDKSLFYKMVKINSDKSVLKKEISNYFRDVIFSADSEISFDQNNLLKDLYDDLVVLNEKNILILFNKQIFADFYKKLKFKEVFTPKDIIIIQERLKFFLQLEQFDNDIKIANCLEIEKFVHKICLEVINQTENLGDFIYYYVINIFDFVLFNCEARNITSLYINNLAYLLAIITKLLKNYKFEEVKIIAKNIDIENNNKNLIYKFKFLMGLVKIYIVLLYKDKKNKTNIINKNCNILKEIYELFKNKFFNYEEIDFNKLFVDLIGLEPDEIDCSIDIIEYNLLRDKYSNRYYGFSVARREAMFYTFLTIYDCLENDSDIIFEDKINLIERMELYLEYMNHTNINKSLLKFLCIDKDIVNSFSEEFVYPLLNKIEDEEHRYASDVDISNEIEIVRRKISNLLDIENNENFDYVDVKIIKSKSQKGLSKYNVIPVEEFKKNFIINDDLLKHNYKDAFLNLLLNEMRKALNGCAIKKECTLDNYLKELNSNEFIIITDVCGYSKIKDYEKKYNIKIYATLKMDYFQKGQIFIVNKKGLPVVELHKIDDKDDNIKKEYIINEYQYIEIKRLSDSVQENEIRYKDIVLTKEEKKEYVFIRVLLAFDVKMKNGYDVILFEDID